MTVGALVLGLVLGFLARHKMRRTPAAPALTDPRRQLGDACIALRQGGYRVQERTLGARTIVLVDKKTKG